MNELDDTPSKADRAKVLYFDPDRGWCMLLRKHYDKPLKEIAREDPGYLRWLMEKADKGEIELTVEQVMVMRTMQGRTIGSDLADSYGDCE